MRWMHFRGAVAAAGLVLAGCNPTFDVKVESESTIRSGTILQNILGDAFGSFVNMDLSQSSDFKNTGVGKEDVERVRLRKLTLTITAPESADFDFLSSIRFFVESGELPRVRVADKGQVARGVRVVELDVVDAELQPYVTAPRMSLTTEANARAPTRDTVVKAEAVFAVTPKIF
jgi:hypothetical protein